MGIQDREWYREEMKQRRINEEKDVLRSKGAKSNLPDLVFPEPGKWSFVFIRAAIYCFAIYGLLSFLLALFHRFK